jgi:hypothetical protein
LRWIRLISIGIIKPPSRTGARELPGRELLGRIVRRLVLVTAAHLFPAPNIPCRPAPARNVSFGKAVKTRVGSLVTRCGWLGCGAA